MLDEFEFALVDWALDRLRRTANRKLDQGRIRSAQADVERVPRVLERMLGPTVDGKVLLEHLRLHRLSNCGPSCRRCGKVLRTRVASKCFECGYAARNVNIGSSDATVAASM